MKSGDQDLRPRRGGEDAKVCDGMGFSHVAVWVGSSDWGSKLIAVYLIDAMREEAAFLLSGPLRHHMAVRKKAPRRPGAGRKPPITRPSKEILSIRESLGPLRQVQTSLDTVADHVYEKGR